MQNGETTYGRLQGRLHKGLVRKTTWESAQGGLCGKLQKKDYIESFSAIIGDS